ncbi:hypothetical protein INT47_002890 [Mucor saturninus]|uniref:DDE Tnp4 domain-containing protein n=1 Tax=Mucor saturninus TaxID=64648 RepID=A0A8H7URA6_9FUNG|nr:hypothetical protein INT47_002890 [Mucor saturninus]
MLSLESNVIQWPGKEQKERIKDLTEKSNGFPDCLGFVDGTLIHLEYKPKFREMILEFLEVLTWEKIWTSTLMSILGDSGYSLEKNVIIPYRDNEKGGFTKEMKKFNYLHAKTRVSIENCFECLEDEIW